MGILIQRLKLFIPNFICKYSTSNLKIKLYRQLVLKRCFISNENDIVIDKIE